VAKRCRDVCGLQTADGRAYAATCPMRWCGVDAHRSSLVASRWRLMAVVRDKGACRHRRGACR